MKKILLFLLIALSVAAWGNKLRRIRPLPLIGTHTTSATYTPFANSQIIHSADICGSVVLNSDTSLVRIIMTDTEGMCYLIYEATPMLLNGYTDSIKHANEETDWLCGVQPVNVKLEIKDASLSITALNTTVYDSVIHHHRAPLDKEAIRRAKVQAKVDNINSFNQRNNILWRAGVTDIAMQDYPSIKRILGFENDNEPTFGVEYYTSGIIEFGSHTSGQEGPVTPIDTVPSVCPFDKEFIPVFDWRNRHNKNWNTCVKNQGKSGFCYSFATVATLESLLNLQLNDTVNYDLSELDIAFYCHNDDHHLDGSGWHGGGVEYAANYAISQGVCLESDLPYSELTDSATVYKDALNTRRSGLNTVRAQRYGRIPKIYYYTKKTLVDTIKSALIKNGPMISGISHNKGGIHHAMELVGYMNLHDVDSLTLLVDTAYCHNYPISTNLLEEYKGRDIWIFKNSYYNTDGNGHDGYMYALFSDYNYMTQPLFFESPMELNLATMPIPCIQDNDRDGYYTWGFKQSKPTVLPDWVPIAQDGDDNNRFKGPIDRYGICQDLSYNPNDTIYIKDNKEYSSFKYIIQPIVVCNGASLTISSRMTCNDLGCIIIRDKSNLNLREAKLENISLIVENEGKVNLQNRQRLHLSRTHHDSAHLH